MRLNITHNIVDLDAFYERLLLSYDGLSRHEAEGFSARLILLLANHVGDTEVLNDALLAAGRSPRQRCHHMK